MFRKSKDVARDRRCLIFDTTTRSDDRLCQLWTFFKMMRSFKNWDKACVIKIEPSCVPLSNFKPLSWDGAPQSPSKRGDAKANHYAAPSPTVALSRRAKERFQGCNRVALFGKKTPTFYFTSSHHECGATIQQHHFGCGVWGGVVKNGELIFPCTNSPPDSSRVNARQKPTLAGIRSGDH